MNIGGCMHGVSILADHDKEVQGPGCLLRCRLYGSFPNRYTPNYESFDACITECQGNGSRS